MHDGKLCASTTRYYDQTKGACGCGKSDPIPPDWWTLTQLTAAYNCKNLDPDRPLTMYCPSGCGGCYKLCATGGTTVGHNTTPGVCRVFKVTNRCGDGYDGGPTMPRNWCSHQMSWKECQEKPEQCKKEGSTNWYGYPAHFDLQDFHHQIDKGLGWDNVEVTFEPVSCDSWKGPPASKRSCECEARGKEPVGGEGAGGGAGADASKKAAKCGAAYEQCGGKGSYPGAVVADCCQAGCTCGTTDGASNGYRQCRPAEGAGTCGTGSQPAVLAALQDHPIGKAGAHGTVHHLMAGKGALLLAMVPVAITLIVVAGRRKLSATSFRSTPTGRAAWLFASYQQLPAGAQPRCATAARVPAESAAA